MKIRFRGVKFRSKRVVAGLLALVLVISVAAYNFVYTKNTDTSKDYQATSGSSKYGDTIYIDGVSSAPKFRSNAKFKIIELVPYRGMAELGYTIKGEEPIRFTDIEESDWKNYICQYTKSVSGTDSEPLSYDSSTKTITNRSFFVQTTLKTALDLSTSQANQYDADNLVDVLVLEPSQLNANPDLIDEADMIYVHNNFSKGYQDWPYKVMNMYEKYSKEFNSSSEEVEKNRTTHGTNNLPKFESSNDISWEVTLKLFYYGCVSKSPLIVEGCAMDTEKATLNLQKLALLLLADEYFTNDYTFNGEKVSVTSSTIYTIVKDFSSDSNATITDGSNTKYIWTYKGIGWAIGRALNSETTCNMGDNLGSGIENYKATYDNGALMGDAEETTLAATAHGGGEQSLICSKIGISDTLNISSDICSAVKNDTRDIAITIFNGQKPTLVVLEVQPDNSFDLSWSDVSKWIPEGVLVKLQIDSMTMSEFIGHIDDINAEYDIIYFGKNQANMKSSDIYTNGISAASSQLQVYTDTDSADYKYSGNDITEKTMKNVKNFINAGYPVIYENTLASDSAMDDDSNMYTFITENASNMYAAQDKKLTNVSTLPSEKLSMGKVDISYSLDSGVSEYSEGTSSGISSTIDGISFTTKYFNKNTNYTARLYIDTNYDGVYNEWSYSEGSWLSDTVNYECAWSQTFTPTNSKSISISSYAISEEALQGVVSWKLEVTKLNSSGSSSGVRSYITGNAHVSQSKKTINVLQISDPETGIDLSTNSYFQNWATNSIVSSDYKIEVTYRDVNEALDSADFSDYDIFILGFIDEDTTLADGNGLINNLKWLASKGKGVIVTQDALTYYNNASASKWGDTTNLGLREILGLDVKNITALDTTSIPAKNYGFTYSVLNLFSSDTYFSNLSKSVEDSDSVSMINNAKICRYPYIISMNNTDGFSTTSGIYQANLEESVDGQVYYCLSNSDSGNYSVSPNDAKNNYYLWRNDSTFYSGVTTESFSGDYENEQKLFINTIISAYGLERGVYVNVTNLPESYSSTISNTYVLYVDVDYDKNSLSGSSDIDFKITQKGLKNPTVSVKFYKCDSNGTILDVNGDDVGDESDTISVKASGSTFTPVSSGSDSHTISLNTEYTFEYPLDYLSDNAGLNSNILIVAEQVGTNGAVSDNALVRVLRRNLFDLD